MKHPAVSPRILALATGLVVALAGCSSATPTADSTTASTPTPTTAPIDAAAIVLQGVNDPGWRISNSQFREGGIEGYANAVSVLPGEPVTLFVSSPTRAFTIDAYRMTGTATSGALRVWRSPRLTGGRQTATIATRATRSVAADWEPTVTVSTKGWNEGAYLFRLAATDGSASYVPLTVRSKSTAGKVVIANAVLTWQAYNTWGGSSTYTSTDDGGSFSTRAYAASFDRPYVKGKGTGKFLSYELPVILRAERLGIPLAYETVLDVATRPGLLKGARGYVSLGHDEYWTASERDAVESARDAGTNLAFLGANVSYWQVRLRAGPLGTNRVMDVYKSRTADPVKGNRATVLFRDVGRGENLMTGQFYECYPATGDYTVINPGFFLFRGTGAVKGSTYRGVLEVEVDRAQVTASTPRPLQVVARSRTTCGSTSTWSTSSYYTVKSGAGVFSTGSMGWILCGLGAASSKRSANFVGTVTDNVLREMAKGPMGLSHPAVNNLDSLSLGG